MHSLEEELYRFVAQEILRLQDVEYCMDLIEIADPYNCLFRNIGSGSQDEYRNISTYNFSLRFSYNAGGWYRTGELFSVHYFLYQLVYLPRYSDVCHT